MLYKLLICCPINIFIDIDRINLFERLIFYTSLLWVLTLRRAIIVNSWRCFITNNEYILSAHFWLTSDSCWHNARALVLLAFSLLFDTNSSRLRLNKRVSITVPDTPGGVLEEASFTSPALSPKIARSNFSSGVGSVSPFG